MPAPYFRRGEASYNGGAAGAGRVPSVDAMNQPMTPQRATARPQRRPGTRLRAEGWTFLREAARDPRAVGAVAPSGKALALALTEPVRAQPGRPLDVLEAGAGTGAVTRVLIPQLSPGSRLDIAEANPRFADRLRDLVRTRAEPAEGPYGEQVEGPYGEAAREPSGEPSGTPSAQIRVHAARVERLETGRRYDVIVSGLPFTNFAPADVEAIMERYLRLLRPGGTLTYFAYRGTRRARTLLLSRTDADRHRAVETVLAAYRRRHGTGSRTVWANLPPATVWQLGRPVHAFPLLGPFPDSLPGPLPGPSAPWNATSGASS